MQNAHTAHITAIDMRVLYGSKYATWLLATIKRVGDSSVIESVVFWAVGLGSQYDLNGN